MTPEMIHITDQKPAFRPLPLGGANPSGCEISANSCCLMLDGKPWLPVMGEFHFSRCPKENWEAELLKMKAGGITVAATYLFWIHIEEIEGQFDWSGNHDIRHFIELCANLGLYAYPRIGPWAHGECRNGGFPDWLLEKCVTQVRQDAQPYLSFVQRYYQEIANQLKGLLWKDGGPIIGIQIENELLNNPGHLLTLRGMARAAGLDVPLYTMTGWGPAEVPPGGNLLPVFGGYPDAFWDRQVQTWSRDSRKHYFFSHLRDDNTVGADLNKREGVFDLSYLEDYPFGTCELGGGMQIAYHRRPLILPDEIAALAQVKIGSGSNLQGYYMYHGGANALGQLSTLQESQATGYWNDLPVINYDFQAPLGQYGQVREHYHSLRLQHYFLNEFGAGLAPMPMTLPDSIPATLDDRDTLRWAVRSDGRAGFIFINNYQRIEPLPEHRDVQLQLCLPEEELTIPPTPVAIRSGEFAIWPFNLEMNGILLKHATAQLVCRLAGEGNEPPVYVFFAQDGIPPVFTFEAGTQKVGEGPGLLDIVAHQQVQLSGLQPGPDCYVKLQSLAGQHAALLVLTRSQALGLWKARIWGAERLFLCHESLSFHQEQVSIQADLPTRLELAVFPPVASLRSSTGPLLDGYSNGIFAAFTLDLPAHELPVEVLPVRAAGPARQVPIGPLGVAQAPDYPDFDAAAAWQIEVGQAAWARLADPHNNELLLRLHYSGDVARLYASTTTAPTHNQHLLDDQFFYGEAWEIGLRRFEHLAGQPLSLTILPLRRDAPIYLPETQWPDFHGQPQIAEIHKFELVERMVIRFSQA